MYRRRRRRRSSKKNKRKRTSLSWDPRLERRVLESNAFLFILLYWGYCVVSKRRKRLYFAVVVVVVVGWLVPLPLLSLSSLSRPLQLFEVAKRKNKRRRRRKPWERRLFFCPLSFFFARKRAERVDSLFWFFRECWFVREWVCKRKRRGEEVG